MLRLRINFALIVSVLTFVIGIPSVRAQNELNNPNFESSTQSWWVPGDGNLELVDDAYEGNKACRISGRTRNWNGISQTLLGKLEDGKDYHFSCYVKTVGIPEAEVLLEIAQRDDRGDMYPRIGTALANDKTWTRLQGGFKLESNGPLTSLHFTVNTTSTDPGTFDFILDSVSVTENDWEADANARIELHRKRNVNLNIADQAGIVQPNVDVDIKQVGHHFAFGSTLNTAFINNARYRDFFKQRFEWATSEWYLQWKPVEWVRTNEDYMMADATVEFAEENGIKLRGHALAWPDERFRPDWLTELSAEDVRTELEERITNVVSRYSSRLQHWDVCNEILNYSYFRDTLDTLDDPIEPWMFQQARSYDSNVRLCMNEFGIIDSQYKAQRYRENVLYHKKNGADVGGIGLQSHFQLSYVSPKSIEISVNKLKDLGPEIWFTEFDVSNPDPVERAEALETFYRYAFSVPEAHGIIMWGFWAGTDMDASSDERDPGEHWRGPDASLVDSDWKINAAGQKYFKLMDDWTTTGSGLSDAAGEAGFRGFHGDYLITTTNPNTDAKNYHLISVPPGEGDLNVDLILDATPNSLTIYGTDGDDNFEYDLDFTSKVLINSQPVVFSLPVDTTVVRFAGLGGTDHLEVKARELDGRVRITDSELTSRDDGFAVSYTGIETADVVAPEESFGSSATFLDSRGDDTFESYLDASTLTTSKTSITAKGFFHVYAYSRFGSDFATLFDSVHMDTISSNLASATIREGMRIRRAHYFAEAEFVSLSGNDSASVSLPAGAKTISASPKQVTVVSGGVTHKFTDISRTRFDADAEDLYTVLLSGSDAAETLYISQAYSAFFGPNFLHAFRGIPSFKTAAGPDLGGRDRLIFSDSDGDDTFNASGDTVTISGSSGYLHQIKFADVVFAYSRRDGVDTATQSSPSATVRLSGAWK